jgi:Protein of unknown function (DUF3237)
VWPPLRLNPAVPLQPATPQLEFVAHFDIEIDESLRIGETPLGQRRVIPIIGGRFEGPQLRGVIVPGGADWLSVRSDGVSVIDTRYTLRTHDDALISIFTSGLGFGSADGDYYFRQTLRFETAAPGYEWLMRAVFVAAAVLDGRTVRYDAYRVT